MALFLSLWVQFTREARAGEATVVLLVERWRIPGQIAGEAMGRIVSVARGDEGRVFLLDGKLSCVYVVDERTGELVDSFGKEGEGPGDLRHAQFAFTEGADRLDIVSLTPPSIQALTCTGDYLDNRPLNFGNDFVFVTLGRAARLDGGYVVSGMRADVNMDQVAFVGAATPDLELSRTYALQMTAEHGKARLHDLAFDVPRWDTDGTRIFISSEYAEYRIDVFGFDGSVRRRLHRDYEHLRRSDEDVEYLKKYFLEARKTGAVVDASVDPFHRDIEDFHILRDGRLLVLTSRGARATDGPSMGEFDVLDSSEGTLERRVRFAGEGDPLFDDYIVCGDLLFVVTDMEPPTRHPGRERERDVPFMSVICYELGVPSGG